MTESFQGECKFLVFVKDLSQVEIEAFIRKRGKLLWSDFYGMLITFHDRSRVWHRRQKAFKTLFMELERREIHLPMGIISVINSTAAKLPQ